MNFWDNLNKAGSKALNSADTTRQYDLPVISGKKAQNMFYPGVPDDELRKLNDQVFLNRWNNMPRSIRDRMTLAQFTRENDPSRGWDASIYTRTYDPPPSSPLSRLFNYAYNKVKRHNPFTRNKYVIEAQNSDEAEGAMKAYYDGSNARTHLRYNPSKPASQVILMGVPQTYTNNPYRPFNLYKNQASGGNLLTKKQQDLLMRDGYSKEVVDLLFENDPSRDYGNILNHERGHAFDATSLNINYLLDNNWDQFNKATANAPKSVNNIKNRLYLLRPVELMNGVGTALRSLRSLHWADTGKLPVPGDATDVNNVRQFFNMNYDQMEKFLNRVDRSKLQPAVRLWGTLRMLKDEKKKQEIIDFISKNMVPYMVQNNNQRFRNNPRV